MTKMAKHSWMAVFLAICLIIGICGNLMKSGAVLWGVVVLLISVVTFAAAHNLGPLVNRLTARQMRIMIGIGLTLMLVGQVLILIFLPDTIYHDPYRILSQADQMAAGHNIWNTTYFWRYPNNVSLTYLLSLWFRLTSLVGMSTNVASHILTITLLDTFIIMTLVTLKQLSERNSIVLGGFTFLVLSPFAYTYYLQVFYSDLPSMLILLMIFRILWRWRIKSNLQRICTGIGLTMLVLVGQLLKPNLIVLLPALFIIVVILWHRKLLRTTKLTVPFLLIVAGFGLSVPTTQVIHTAANFHPNAAYELPVTSWMLMGVNTNSDGMYSTKDIEKAITLKDKQAVEQYDIQTIQTRVKKLGVFGLMKLWLVKIGILLNVRSIQDWYNGGFQSAPTWYDQHSQFLRAVTAVSYQVVTIVLWLTLIIRLLAWRPDLRDETALIGLLAIVTALGYLAFHTLLWETEERYGQAIVPLVLFALGALPNTARKRVVIPKRTRNRLAVGFALAAILGLSTFSGLLAKDYPNTIVVAAQRSQLSTQYHAKPQLIAPNTVMSEEISLNGASNYLSVQIHQAAGMKVTLTSPSTGKVYKLKPAATVYKLETNIAAGHYRITAKNTSGIGQQVDVVNTQRYQLAEYPLVVNGVKNATASFVYTSLYQPT